MTFDFTHYCENIYCPDGQPKVKDITVIRLGDSDFVFGSHFCKKCLKKYYKIVRSLMKETEAKKK